MINKIELNNRMVQYPDRQLWILDGYEVIRIIVDYAFTIDALGDSNKNDDNSVTIVIETPFTIKNDGKVMQFEPERKETLGQALDILHKSIESLTAFRSGCLVIRFMDNSEIVVEKNDSYESWTTFGTGEIAQIAMRCTPHKGPPWSE